MKHFLVYPGLFMEGQQFANTINKTPRGESTVNIWTTLNFLAAAPNTTTLCQLCSDVLMLYCNHLKSTAGAGPQYDMRRLVSL